MPSEETNELIVTVSIRCVFYVLFKVMDVMYPRVRTIPKEEVWMYKNEITPDYVPDYVLWPITILLPATVLFCFYQSTKSRSDLFQSVKGLTLAIPLTLCLCSFLKLTIGRPRPDFYWRCFPDDRYAEGCRACTGNLKDVMDGRKSFPSMHTALSITSLGYTFFYMCGKWHICKKEGLSDTKNLLMCMFVLFLSIAVGVSRIVDNHHHIEDVMAGACIGLGLAYVCYRHYYPALSDEDSNYSYIDLPQIQFSNSSSPMLRVQAREDTSGLVKRFRKRHDSFISD